ncbi:ABC transporter ATP-binding protein [Sphaerisporangium krabiense]|uniref:ABC-2 type transport system ATP-binding protein n=1 Tax=Sphaerisporangium krabiense TaxID=763782 RepID=A0A7W8ZBW7_9ACTN|nr:ABC transporter ATP-binding protein [Sphaerisporangium krabiense]MBB5631061.1 ABC-2 type transport system ATP-binding protein [Sphaerisporangium krabiense]GII65944.1 ABC transporter ATP-binding protein [Sphaerisporangium krabiense]
MNAITFTDVSKAYGEAPAVDGLNLTMETGRTVALLGPNGAGKSTTINMLLGLVRPGAGRVEIFGRTPDEAVAAGMVGAMLQDGALIPELTVRETVDFVRRLYPAPLPLEDVLEMAGLTGLAGRRAGALSGGQAQRVRFALAVVGAPRLLVLDEPTTAMDVESRRAFWESMRAYAEGGRTVLFATHYLEEADENADRVIVMVRGRVAADGTAAQIRAGAGGSSVSFSLGGQSLAGLDALPGVSSVEVDAATVRLRTADVDATVDALYRGTTLQVRDLRVRDAALEDAFLALTRHAED